MKRQESEDPSDPVLKKEESEEPDEIKKEKKDSNITIKEADEVVQVTN